MRRDLFKTREKEREREGEERKRKEKKKKGEKTEERTKFLTPSKSICPRYQTANGYCENDDCKRKRGIKKKKGKRKKKKSRRPRDSYFTKEKVTEPVQ